MIDAKPRMQRVVRDLAERLAAIRTGTVDAGVVASVVARRDGRATPLGRLATVANQAGRIVVRPFDASHAAAILDALQGAQLSAYSLDPRTIAVTIPPPSGEQRARLAKQVKALGEEAKIAVRLIRQDARKQIAADGRGSERRVQEATDAAVAELETLLARKLKEIAD